MNIATLLVRATQIAPENPALAIGSEPIASYTELLERVRRLAGGLRSRNIQSGSRVALFAGNRADYIEVMLATWWVGATVVPINAKLARPELDVILDLARPELLMIAEDTAEVAFDLDAIMLGGDAFDALRSQAPSGEAPEPRSADDCAWLFFTSGTTGTPKGAMISHGNLLSMTQGYLSDVDDIPVGAALIHFAPISHGSGIYILPSLARAGISVVGPTPRMTPDVFFDLVAAWPEASLFAAPTIVTRLAETARDVRPDLSNLRTIVCGGGPLYLPDLKQAYGALGPVFAQIYGQGECPMTITAQSRREMTTALLGGDDAYLKTVGRPFIGTELRITKTDGRACDVGETGEVLVRSPTVIPGYWKKPDATAGTIQDGWLYTGDLGRLDARGCLTLDGRSKEVIISGGSNVYPIEVEAVLLQHPDVAAAAVMGRPDPQWGETVTAFVALHDRTLRDLSQDLDAFCAKRIARFKCPKRYLFRTSLPTNAYGKIAKRELVAETD